MGFRVEVDSLGEVRVPEDALWGAQTQRAVDNGVAAGCLPQPLVLSLVGGLLGSLFAVALLDPFLSILPPDTPRLGEIGVDTRILTFSALLTFLCGAFVAALPALKTSGTGMAPVLQDTGRGTLGGRKRSRLQAGLLVSQIALAFVFLFAAGLFIRSFDHLTSVDRGFSAEGVVVLEVDMGGYRYVEAAQPRPAYDELVQRLDAGSEVSKSSTSDSMSRRNFFPMPAGSLSNLGFCGVSKLLT